jgi:hypothetical protein
VLLADGFDRPFSELMTRWSLGAPPHGDPAGSRELLRYFLRLGKPEEYLALVARYPKLLCDPQHPLVALSTLETRDAAKAVEQAEVLLGVADTLHYAIPPKLVALLTAHAPSKAESWAKKNAKKLGGHDRSRFVFLAALGQTDPVRKGLKELEGDSALLQIAEVTPSHGLAVEVLKAYSTPGRLAATALVDLGERAWVDEQLEKTVAKIARMAPKARNHWVGGLAFTAGTVGRFDLALKIFSLSTKSAGAVSAHHCVRGCASVGDWTSAWAALHHVPDNGSGGRVSTAVHFGLEEALDAPFSGPRAYPLRARES